LFETLTELMQGPCPGNQLLLAQSRLVEAINGMWNAVTSALHHRAGGSGDYGSWDSLACIMERDGEEGAPGSGAQKESSVDDEDLLPLARDALLMKVAAFGDENSTHCACMCPALRAKPCAAATLDVGVVAQ
jgi:hypothetical protein